jgi:hypothetical protein
MFEILVTGPDLPLMDRLNAFREGFQGMASVENAARTVPKSTNQSLRLPCRAVTIQYNGLVGRRMDSMKAWAIIEPIPRRIRHNLFLESDLLGKRLNGSHSDKTCRLGCALGSHIYEGFGCSVRPGQIAGREKTPGYPDPGATPVTSLFSGFCATLAAECEPA